MPSPNGRVPAYRLHKPSGQARVIVNHEHIYLGKYGSVESRKKYARLIAELASANGQAKADCRRRRQHGPDLGQASNFAATSQGQENISIGSPRADRRGSMAATRWTSTRA